MTKVKMFFGQIKEVENRINVFLEQGYELIDIKQSLDQEPEAIHTYGLWTLIYKDTKSN